MDLKVPTILFIFRIIPILHHRVFILKTKEKKVHNGTLTFVDSGSDALTGGSFLGKKKLCDNDGALICNVNKITFVKVYLMDVYFFCFRQILKIKRTHLFQSHDIGL